MSFARRLCITFVLLASSQAFAATMFLGNTVQFSHKIDNTGPIIDGDNQFRCGDTNDIPIITGVNVIVDNTVEITNCDGFVSVDISDSNILVTFLATAGPTGGLFFNGLHFFDVNDQINAILGVSVTGSTASRVTFDENNVYFDMQQISGNLDTPWQNGATVSIDVTFAPEPSAAVLLFAGLGGLILMRRRIIRS